MAQTNYPPVTTSQTMNDNLLDTVDIRVTLFEPKELVLRSLSPVTLESGLENGVQPALYLLAHDVLVLTSGQLTELQSRLDAVKATTGALLSRDSLMSAVKAWSSQ